MDLQARLNALSVRRDQLNRRFPGIALLGERGGLGAEAPREAVEEWRRLTDDLRRVQAQLNLLDP
jgi:hypothetical protein